MSNGSLSALNDIILEQFLQCINNFEKREQMIIVDTDCDLSCGTLTARQACAKSWIFMDYLIPKTKKDTPGLFGKT